MKNSRGGKKKIQAPVRPSQGEFMCNRSLRAFSSLDSEPCSGTTTSWGFLTLAKHPQFIKALENFRFQKRYEKKMQIKYFDISSAKHQGQSLTARQTERKPRAQIILRLSKSL